MSFTVVSYQPTDFERWNAFIRHAKNSTFLFHRDFLSYHKQRFEDASVMIYEKDALIAVFPANFRDEMVVSHEGLSYGGLVCLKEIRLNTYLGIWEAVLRYYQALGIRRIRIKSLPSIYSNYRSDELGYVIFLLEGVCYRKDVLLVVNQANRLKISNNRKRSIDKGFQEGFYVEENDDFELFWSQILEPNLLEKHGVRPVHSVEDMRLLKQRFPKEIRLFNAYAADGTLAAGVVVFKTDRVAHLQYISGTPAWNAKGAVDWLHHYLMEVVFRETPYFDFGSCNELEGRKLNGGLLHWKEGFGARTVVQEFYELEVERWNNLNQVWL